MVFAWFIPPLFLATVWGLNFRTDELPRAIRGVPYDARIETVLDGRCPGGDVGLSLASGALPPGLHLVSTGISGVPRETGNFRFRVRAANRCRWVIQQFEMLVTGRPLLEVSSHRLDFEFHAGDTTPQRKPVIVSAGWPDLAYVASGAKAWLKLTPLEGRTSRTGSPLADDQLTIEVNAASLAAGSYQATVEVSAWEAASTPSLQVLVTVLPK